jgi:protein farnesyltransferase subunit beta
MDDCTLIEEKHNQINRSEIIYQKILMKRVYEISIVFQKIRKSNLKYEVTKKKFSNIFDTEQYLNEYLKKFGFFFLPCNQIQSWIFSWFFNSIKISRSNLNFYFLKNVEKILFSIFCYDGERKKIFPNSYSLVLLYASGLSLFSIIEFSYKLSKIFVIQIYSFIKKLICFSKFFRCNILGEIDSRAIYCSLVILSLLNCFTPKIVQIIIKNFDNFFSFDNTMNFVKFKEGHGALTFCFLGSLTFFTNPKFSFKLNSNFKFWFDNKMKFFDFGIQGRYYKIIDSCYIFWILSISIIGSLNFSSEIVNSLFFIREKNFKGFSDYIGKIPDLYHTYYSICGLSLVFFLKKFKPKKFFKKNIYKKKNFIYSKLNPIYGIREISFFFSI